MVHDKISTIKVEDHAPNLLPKKVVFTISYVDFTRTNGGGFLLCHVTTILGGSILVGVGVRLNVSSFFSVRQNRTILDHLRDSG